MNKKYISLTIVLLIAIGMLPTLFGQTHLEEIVLAPEMRFDCASIKLVASESVTLGPNQGQDHDIPYVSDDCFYLLLVRGCTTACQEDDGRPCAVFYYVVDFVDPEENDYISGEQYPCEGECIPDIGILLPGSAWKEVEKIQVRTLTGECGIEYSWEFYSICPCEKGKQALYPKVDIEQFSVTGGPTLIKDGKILSGFEVAPGVQQTMIQIENRGFFTQNDAKVKFLGLPQGVTVEITPNTQKIKAHKLGTYQATFTVGTDVPSGTYKVAMIAYSDKGVFDTIQMDLIVP